MSFVLKPLYISFYVMNVYRVNGHQKFEYIVIFISCQLFFFEPLKKYTGSVFFKLSHSSLSVRDQLFLLFLSLFHRSALVCLNSCSISCRGHTNASSCKIHGCISNYCEKKFWKSDLSISCSKIQCPYCKFIIYDSQKNTPNQQ